MYQLIYARCWFGDCEGNTNIPQYTSITPIIGLLVLVCQGNATVQPKF